MVNKDNFNEFYDLLCRLLGLHNKYNNLLDHYKEYKHTQPTKANIKHIKHSLREYLEGIVSLDLELLDKYGNDVYSKSDFSFLSNSDFKRLEETVNGVYGCFNTTLEIPDFIAEETCCEEYELKFGRLQAAVYKASKVRVENAEDNLVNSLKSDINPFLTCEEAAETLIKTFGDVGCSVSSLNKKFKEKSEPELIKEPSPEEKEGFTELERFNESIRPIIQRLDEGIFHISTDLEDIISQLNFSLLQLNDLQNKYEKYKAVYNPIESIKLFINHKIVQANLKIDKLLSKQNPKVQKLKDKVMYWNDPSKRVLPAFLHNVFLIIAEARLAEAMKSETIETKSKIKKTWKFPEISFVFMLSIAILISNFFWAFLFNNYSAFLIISTGVLYIVLFIFACEQIFKGSR